MKIATRISVIPAKTLKNKADEAEVPGRAGESCLWDVSLNLYIRGPSKRVLTCLIIVYFTLFRPRLHYNPTFAI